MWHPHCDCWYRLGNLKYLVNTHRKLHQFHYTFQLLIHFVGNEANTDVHLIRLAVKWKTGRSSRFPFVIRKALSTTQSSWYWLTTSFAGISVFVIYPFQPSHWTSSSTFSSLMVMPMSLVISRNLLYPLLLRLSFLTIPDSNVFLSLATPRFLLSASFLALSPEYVMISRSLTVRFALESSESVSGMLCRFSYSWNTPSSFSCERIQSLTVFGLSPLLRALAYVLCRNPVSVDHRMY